MSCTDTESSFLCSNRAWSVCRALSPTPKSPLGSAGENSSEFLVSHRDLLCALPSVHPWLEDECPLGCSCRCEVQARLNSPQIPQGGSQRARCLSTSTSHFSSWWKEHLEAPRPGPEPPCRGLLNFSWIFFEKGLTSLLTLYFCPSWAVLL